MIEIAFFGVLGVGFLIGGTYTVYKKFFAQVREWPETTPMNFGAQAYPVREEPFYSWWRDNADGMGQGTPVELSPTMKRKIDVVCQDMQVWTYLNDKPTVDFEPVFIDQQSGDCEDFARVMALRLIDAGVPAGSITFGLGYHPRAGWHCITLLNTSAGGYMAEVGNAMFRPWETNGFVKGNGCPNNGVMAPKPDGFFYDVVS